jgi:hypothetical protein
VGRQEFEGAIGSDYPVDREATAWGQTWRLADDDVYGSADEVGPPAELVAPDGAAASPACSRVKSEKR